MKAYIEEGAWLVCSYDLAGTPQQLQRHLSDEFHRVQHISGKRLLTVEDKNTKDCFKCKLPVKQWSGLFALIGGMAFGVAVAVALSGPVGWVALGAVAAVAIAGTVAYFAHDCAEPQSGGEWQDFHPTVTIKGESAILYQHSMLTCGNGGILIAFESFEVAQTTADKANNYAWGEIGLQVISNALIGGVSGYFGGISVSGVGFATAFYAFTEVVMPSDPKPIDTAGAGLFLSTIYGNRMANWLTGKPFNYKVFLGDFVGAVISFVSDTYEGKLKDCSTKIIEDSSQNPTLQKSVITTTV